MAATERAVESWFSATLDLLLAVFGFTIVWYPIVSVGSAVLGVPVSSSTSNLLVGALALGGSYPVVAGNWSLGQLGEYIFVLLASALCWGVLGMIAFLALGASASGSNPAPRAAVLAAAALLKSYSSDISSSETAGR